MIILLLIITPNKVLLDYFNLIIIQYFLNRFVIIYNNNLLSFLFCFIFLMKLIKIINK